MSSVSANAANLASSSTIKTPQSPLKPPPIRIPVTGQRLHSAQRCSTPGVLILLVEGDDERRPFLPSALTLPLSSTEWPRRSTTSFNPDSPAANGAVRPTGSPP